MAKLFGHSVTGGRVVVVVNVVPLTLRLICVIVLGGLTAVSGTSGEVTVGDVPP